MLTLALALLDTAEARDRCAGAPWYLAVARLDEATVPSPVQVVPGSALPRLTNPGPIPLVLLDAARSPADRLVDGQAFHWFGTGVPVEGMGHLTGWQNPYGVTSVLLPAPPPTSVRSGRGRPADARPPANEPFSVDARYGDDTLVLRGEWRFEIDPAYDAEACAR